MQYEISDTNLLVNIYNQANIDAVQNITYIKSGIKEIENSVEHGIRQVEESSAEYIKQSEDWAIKMDGKVGGEDYSSKYYAQQASDIINEGVIAAGSTVSRTLQDRFADEINVKDFGAKGDGVNDDTAAINSAYNAASSKSAKVFFPAGTYLTTGNIAKFLSVIAVGDGKIKRDSEIFDVGENSVNRLYASTNGTGDGLSVNYPSNLTSISNYFTKKRVLYNQWYVHLAAGTYTKRITFIDVEVQKTRGLTISGVNPDRVNNVWTTIFIYPDDNEPGHCLGFNNVKNIQVENISFVGSNVGTGANNFNGVYFYRGVNRIQVFNCKFDNFNYGDAICSQNNNLLFVSNNIIQNSRTGVYVYNTMGSSLATDNTRNLIKNCVHGLYVTGSSYMHNDHNDFEDCTDCAYVDKGAYCGWNDCTETNCTTIFRLEGGSTCNMDNTALASSTTDRLFTFGNTRGTNYELYKQGVYLPNVGVNGAWNYGFNNLVLTEQPVVYNVSSNGADCNNRSSVENKNVLVQSNDSRAGFATLTDQSTSGRRGGFYCYDINGTYGMAGFSSYGGAISTWLDGNIEYVFNSKFFRPSTNNTQHLGSPSYIWDEIYCGNTAINTSDERQKQDIEDIDEAVFRAWEKVDFKQFKFKDAVQAKGENARIHIGLIAQRVKEAFESEGLDGFKYGLLCYDEWDAEPEQTDDDGTIISPAKEAGNAYGIRYAEALALECAYQRWKLEKIEKKFTQSEED